MTQDVVKSKHGDIYSRLMALSQEALENAYYETAYHTLVAAMHFAHATSDEHRLQAVAQVAKTQLDWIDIHNPEHRLSSQSSIQRSGINMYKSLITQARADLLIVQRQNRRE
ncbi:hypothetical protein ACF3DV_02955 [Chlorogloeopsis fritschii PCC 9212]|uniref:Uncharacterized protein n=1 Tax=Chlorogloeopsis fritschii PCC 6912 TaxID=211165 RepID=A0A433N1E5_CHLFR|nr:hypothetical protein [Chlorogloeopsis fritschii]MBF2007491.1 hypothetical protein [Chlorogloeopsis fritschii C42_A2020_084]RUR74832.1 hypothetical protein PCC6912_50100 [Chlorogloeopsis fritschii PCC 6912]